MRGLAVLTVVFVFASSALFVSPASAQGSGDLSGLVCAAPLISYGKDQGCSSGVGLPGATVKLTRSGGLGIPLLEQSPQATTDANGYYSFSNLSPGDYTVAIARTGFQSASATLAVAAGARHDADLTGLVVDAKGKLTDADGAAIAKATVLFCCNEAGQHEATSGSDGRFSVGLQAGQWSVSASAPGFVGQSRSVLVDGSDLSLVLDAIPPQDGRLAGTILDQDGAAVAGARLALSYNGYCCVAYADDAALGSPEARSSAPYDPYGNGGFGYSGENVTFTDDAGRFSIGAFGGMNYLFVSKDGHASQSRSVEVLKGSTTSLDLELLKYPAKTATIIGQVVDAKTGKGVPRASLAVYSPAFGLSECTQFAGDGASGAGSGSAGSAGATEPAPASDAKLSIAPGEPYPGYSPCAITMQDNGKFEARVTPGYAILSVYTDSYYACGYDYSKGPCGPEYYSWTLSQDLPADATTKVDVKLRQRPASDAVVSGYVIDADSGKALPNAYISFSNQDNYGYGSAQTDQDGSFRIKLRAGYHTVSVYAEGHLRWEGVLDVAKGSIPFDVTVTPGQESYGSCCYGPYYGGYGLAADKASAPPGSPTASGNQDAESSDDGDSQQVQYEDLGGGLGPYDAKARSSELDQPSDGAPGIGLLAVLATLGAVFVLRRRAA